MNPGCAQLGGVSPSGCKSFPHGKGRKPGRAFRKPQNVIQQSLFLVVQGFGGWAQNESQTQPSRSGERNSCATWPKVCLRASARGPDIKSLLKSLAVNVHIQIVGFKWHTFAKTQVVDLPKWEAAFDFIGDDGAVHPS